MPELSHQNELPRLFAVAYELFDSPGGGLAVGPQLAAVRVFARDEAEAAERVAASLRRGGSFYVAELPRPISVALKAVGADA